MLATRYPYFGLVLGNLLLILAILAFGYLFCRSAARLYRLIMLGSPDQRFDEPADRSRVFATHVLGQGRLLTEKIGRAHV